jgi:transcriptional regulator with PAS, ATPase and Fis domain
LRVLQDGQVERLGATQPRQVDVRLVAATHQDLAEAVRAGRFRQDLYYRLNVYPIRIPPLRERLDDIEPFARHLLERFATRHDKHIAGLSDRALHALRQYAWPGNMREMENLIERGVILADPGQPVDAAHLFPDGTGAASGTPTLTLQASGRLGETRASGCDDTLIARLLGDGLDLQALETQLMEAAVQRSHGNLAAAARLLGLTRPQLSYRLNKPRES